MQLVLKMHRGMVNSIDPDLTAPCLILVCTVCVCHFVRNFDVKNFRTFSEYCNSPLNDLCATPQITLYILEIDTHNSIESGAVCTYDLPR